MPRALDLAALLGREMAVAPGATAYHDRVKLTAAVDKYRYVLDYIYTAQRRCRVSDGVVREECYINVHFKLLAHCLGRNFARQILANLERWGVVERDGRWARGSKSTGYRLAAAWRGCPHEEVAVDYAVFARRVQTLRREWGQADGAGEEKSLRANLAALAVDHESARAFIAARLRETYGTDDPAAVFARDQQIRDRAGWRWTRLRTARSRRLLAAFYLLAPATPGRTYGAYRALLRGRDAALLAAIDGLYPREAFECDQVALRALQEGHYRLTRDIYGRVHTNLTNLPSHLRPFLFHRQYPSRPLVNVDISNSQPLLLAALVREQYRDAAAIPADARRFVEVCEAGQFYEYLMRQHGTSAAHRAEFKVGVYTGVLFGRENHENKHRAVFARHFPTVAALVSREKRRHHSDLATRLQRIESRLIIDTVVPRLAAAGVWCCTIHDSVVCFGEHAALVGEVIAAALGAAHGLKCTLKVESLRPQHPEPPKMRPALALAAWAPGAATCID